MVSIVISPRFSEGEIRDIDFKVANGEAKTRSDFVRKAVNFYMKAEKGIKI